ncbi:MAG: Gfo/Idh/MocA family oxidoreductase [Victivallaceae bacterium]|nr:Gfo/Idh/MocA family oxidoreductase [Victivallaceae bacterium]
MQALIKNPDAIRLGIIGMTEGNGHPYSWSAIFNGYDRKAMTEECPFAGIPVYLNKENPNSMQITGANVTHIYCDNPKDAEHVAKCSLIPQVVKTPEAMIGEVDAVIIATDIGSEHVKRVRPFVESGLPVFIDKPLCDNRADLQIFRKWIVEERKPIMSSSCMRYAKEFLPYRQRTEELGELRFVSMPMAKKWETYGIHALEAIYPIVGPGFKTIQNLGDAERNIVHMTHRRGIDIIIACVKDIQYGGALRLSGTAGNVNISSSDSFYAFKSQLQAFVNFLRSGQYPFPFSETDELMRLVIGGIESRDSNHKVIEIGEGMGEVRGA